MYVYVDGDVADPRPLRGDGLGRAEVTIGAAAHWLYQAMLNTSVTVSETISEAYTMVDLSDSVNYPHTATDAVWLKKLILDAEVQNSGHFKLYLGVMTEADGTDGSVKWIHVFHIETDTIVRETIDFCQGGDTRGLGLAVSGGAPTYVVSDTGHTDDQRWKTGVALTSPAGSSQCGAGDLVLYLERVGGVAAGEMEFSLTALYSTE